MNYIHQQMPSPVGLFNLPTTFPAFPRDAPQTDHFANGRNKQLVVDGAVELVAGNYLYPQCYGKRRFGEA